MRKIILFLAVAFLIVFAGCVGPGAGTPESMMVNIESGQTYPAYLASPGGEKLPAVVLLHSFNGLEPGYKVMADRFAGEGFVVIAPEWQAHGTRPGDAVVEALIRDTITYLKTRPDVDPARLGLTGFCAGGRYTMLFLPQIDDFGAGVAWYGFPYSRGFQNETAPAEYVRDFTSPMLVIHGSRDQPSPVADIYGYATSLDEAGKYFEMKVYQGEPHGFAIEDGQLSESFAARDAYGEMVGFFERTIV